MVVRRISRIRDRLGRLERRIARLQERQGKVSGNLKRVEWEAETLTREIRRRRKKSVVADEIRIQKSEKKKLKTSKRKECVVKCGRMALADNTCFWCGFDGFCLKCCHWDGISCTSPHNVCCICMTSCDYCGKAVPRVEDDGGLKVCYTCALNDGLNLDC